MEFGVVIITHGKVALELIKAVEIITNDHCPFIPICVEAGTSKVQIDELLCSAIKQANQGHGVLVLADIFGATPCNEAVGLLCQGELEIVTGVNLPMIVKLFSSSLPKTLHEIAKLIRDYGRNHIQLAEDLVK